MNSYLYIKITSKNIHRFLDKIRRNNIDIFNIKYISYKEVIIKIKQEDYKNINKIKSTSDITIISSEGLIKFKELINKNKYFIIISIIGIMFLIFLSNVIFNVNIISFNSDIKKSITKDLNGYGIKKYGIKKSYNEISKIKEELLNKYNDRVEWLEITDIGTTYEIKIVERKKPKKKKKEDYTNIVAKKSGVIKKIYAYSGEKVIEVNNYVNKGEILISGALMKGDEVKAFTDASGKVYAEVWYNVNIEFPLNYTEKKYTNNIKKSPYIKIGNKYFTLKPFSNFEIKKNIYIKNKLLPFEVGIVNLREVKIINDKYSLEEAKREAIKSAKEKILQSLDNDEYIMNEKTLNFYQKDSKIIMDIFFSCFEEIGKKEKIIPE